jgi:hypothetical protein
MRGLKPGTIVRTKAGMSGLSELVLTLVSFEAGTTGEVVNGYKNSDGNIYTYECLMNVTKPFRKVYGDRFWFYRPELTQVYNTKSTR